MEQNRWNEYLLNPGDRNASETEDSPKNAEYVYEQVRDQISVKDRSEQKAEVFAEIETAAAVGAETQTMPELITEVCRLESFNYALQLNGISAVSEVKLQNDSDDDISDLELSIRCTGGVLQPKTTHIDLLPAGRTMSVNDITLAVNTDELRKLTESSLETLTVSAHCGGCLLCQKEYALEILAIDQWNGLDDGAEQLCAFITPNHACLPGLRRTASEFMRRWSVANNPYGREDPSLDGYYGDSNRILALAAAAYEAIRAEKISYTLAPASFGKSGQRIRTADRILAEKMGNCLDLTLLYLSVIESIGLHGLAVLQEGHAFAGVWLENTCFQDVVMDDPTLLSKCLAEGVNELIVVELTGAVNGRDYPFDSARAAAETELRERAFSKVIDVKRARLRGVKPIGFKDDVERTPIMEPAVSEIDVSKPTEVYGNVSEEIAGEEKNARLRRWERKLLDLSMRNPLLNLRPSRKMINLICPSVDELENRLAAETEFLLQPIPEVLGQTTKDFTDLCKLKSNEKLIAYDFEHNTIRSALNETELTKIEKDLYRTAKTGIEESGANSLYLAIGLLKWFETGKSDTPRYAPLMLFPAELVRKSARSEHALRLRDEEAVINVTLLEKLKQDYKLNINGLDPLPEDDHGIDTRKVLSVVRGAIKDRPGWDVLDTAHIGIFSFSQFVMWNDLRNRSGELGRSKIVTSLMNGILNWQAERMELPEKIREDDCLMPISTDASQLYAVKCAAEGKSFVLHGPPGTGKSQTITALIANALAQDRTVLFVAEKMAALEVVQKRLDAIGLGDFCLELHSNKAKKREVLDRLQKAAELVRSRGGDEYTLRSRQLEERRQELNAYADAMHRQRSCGKSLYQLIDEYEANRMKPDLAFFATKEIERLTPSRLMEHQVILEKLHYTAGAVEHPCGHPLSSVAEKDYSQSLRQELPELVALFRKSLSENEERIKAFAAMVGMQCKSSSDIEACRSLAEKLKFWVELPKTWFENDQLNFYLSGMKELCAHGMKAEELKQELLQSWKPEFLNLDGADLLLQLREAEGKWFLAKTLGVNILQRRVSPYMYRKVSPEALDLHFIRLGEYRKELTALERELPIYLPGLGPMYKGENTDWAGIMERAEKASEGEYLLEEGLRLKLSAEPACRKLTQEMCLACMTLEAAEAAFKEKLALYPADSDYFAERKALLNELEDNSENLRNWCLWNRAAAEAENAGLGPVVKAYRSGMALGDVEPAYRKTIARQLASAIIDSEPALNRFTGESFEAQLAQYRRWDTELLQLSRREIYRRLAERLPDFTVEGAKNSEVAILQKAIRSGGRGMTLRRLFEQAPHIIRRLCPCMLMSPISAAQYLDPDLEPFDLVVFDEASQLTTAKAVSALARGNNAVIVGDPKQMPPTSFFVNNALDEDHLDEEDLESILDDCLTLNMPQTHLLWHYRSRHESLISFSNHRFYENRLYTFPSVNDLERKVSLVHVDGYFERGEGRRNRAEAEAVMEELCRRCHDEVLKTQSIGVVTFNIAQQYLIDDLLNEACRKDDELEQWAFSGEEPVFIKNLENVQGDERDVILFSVGYGPDKTGKVSLNFGPLNRDGGWRRLNVAVTRARMEMKVFATLQPEQIRVSPTTPEGVKALQEFLKFAEGGALSENGNASGEKQPTASKIIETVCLALKQKGYDTRLQVGHSACRVDIGVIDPEKPEQYLLGIILDNEKYGEARTARDREVVQYSVLSGLGWRLHRLWTMDWWEEPVKTLNKVLQAVEMAKLPCEPVEEHVDDAEVLSMLKESSDESGVRALPVYQRAVLKYTEKESAALQKTTRGLEEKIRQVIDVEAPVSERALQKRVLVSYGDPKPTHAVLEHYRDALESLGLKSTVQKTGRVFWKADQDPLEYAGFRTAEMLSLNRELAEVPVEELSNTMLYVLFTQVSLPREQLMKSAVQLLGMSRMTASAQEVIQEGLEYAKTRGFIMKDANLRYLISSTGKTHLQSFLDEIDH